MPIPLVPIFAALAAGGTLVPHAAGGMIVTSAAGYVAGTYLSTSVIAGLLAGATATAGAGLALAFGSVRGILGATLARTAVPTVTATTVATGTAVTATTGVMGLLTGPVGISLTVGGAALVIGFGAYRLAKLRRKLSETPEGGEAEFTDGEARIVEGIVKRIANKSSSV